MTVLIQVPINKRNGVFKWKHKSHSLPPLRTDRSAADNLLLLPYAVQTEMSLPNYLGQEEQTKSKSHPHRPLWLTYNKRFYLHSKPKSNEMQSTGERADKSPLKVLKMKCHFFQTLKYVLLYQFHIQRQLEDKTQWSCTVIDCTIVSYIAPFYQWVFEAVITVCPNKHGPQQVRTWVFW